MRKKFFTLGIIIFSIVILSPLVVNARNVEAPATGSEVNSGSSTGYQSGSESNNVVSENATKAKLQGESLSKCQAREGAISNTMARIMDRAQKQSIVIESIQQKVEAFYAKKNMNIDNYDGLKLNIQTKKQLVTQQMNNVQTMKGSFGCGNDDPKGVADQFKTQVASQSDAISEYKKAVHDFVVAIKTALGDNKTTSEKN